MSFIGSADQEQLRSRFERDLDGDVRLVLLVQPPTGLYVPGREEPQTGRQARQLLEEVATLSPKLHLEVYNPRAEPEAAAQYGVERTPALVLLPNDGERREGPGPHEHEASEDAAGGAPDTPSSALRPQSFGAVRFFGLPSGYEFATLMDDLVDVSRRRTRLSDATRHALAALPGPLHLQVFVTPT